MLQDFDDEKLVELILSENEKDLNKATKILHGRSWNGVFQMIKYKGGTEIDAKTILTDAILILIQKIKDGSFDPTKGSLDILLKGIARNKWYDRYNSRNRENTQKTSFEELDQTKNSGHRGSVEDFIFKKEEIKHMAWALSKVKTDCRELFIMIYTKGMQLQTVAERLSISEASVKQRHKRCKEYLRKIYGQDPRID